MSVYPPAHTLPPTSNALSSLQRSALVRTSKKLSKVLGDVPRVPDDGHPPSPAPDLSRSASSTSLVPSVTESIWSKRKPTHLPPLLKLSTPSSYAASDSPHPLTGPVHHRSPTRRGSVLSVAPSILSNAPSTASGSSTSDARPPSEAAQRRTKLERLRRKLGDEVPASAIFPTTPHTAVPTGSPRTPRTARAGHHARPRSRSRSRSRARSGAAARRPGHAADDARSITFSISSDESVHAVTLTAARVHSSHAHKPKHDYRAGALPPVPPIPVHVTAAANDDAGLLRPRQKMAVGSTIGGSDFKAARRAKREGRALSGMMEPGEAVEMVGFM